MLAIHKCRLRQISNGTKVTAYQSKPPVMHPYFFRQFSQIRKNCPVHHNGAANTLIFHKKMCGVTLFYIQMTHFVKTSQFFSGTAVKIHGIGKDKHRLFRIFSLHQFHFLQGKLYLIPIPDIILVTQHNIRAVTANNARHKISYIPLICLIFKETDTTVLFFIFF